MNKKYPRKLILNRETLLRLAEQDLMIIRGGKMKPATDHTCPAICKEEFLEVEAPT
jgi:hypothetical protein